MEKIIDSLLSHDWTIETIFLIVTVLVVIPFKGESALKTILTHFKHSKDYDTNIINKYDGLFEQLKEEYNELKKEYDELKQENKEIIKQLAILRDENITLRNRTA